VVQPPGTAAPTAALFDARSLNLFLAAGPRVWAATRTALQDALLDPAAEAALRPRLVPVDDLQLVLPFEVADYVDFYASIDHASNVGRILRPDTEPLTPNWKHLPIGYHGRAGTVVVSGTDVRRPCGQRKPPHESSPTFGPTRRLDLEAELGFVVGVPSTLGEPVPTSAFADHVFGVVGLNDWSARDIQGWEYVPLGPFLGKSFATSVSAWVTPLSALGRARCPLPGQGQVLDYLAVDEPAGFDLTVEVELDGHVVSRPPYSSMWWSPAQMLAHLTVNGASLRTGDLFASGTISGPERDQRGSLLELSWGGREPFTAGGRERTFLEDGDEVVLRYSAPSERGRILLGEVRGRVLPA
jgi:fumarylacetoacetase